MRYVAVMFGAAGLMFLVAQVLTLMSPEVARKDASGMNRAQSVASESASGTPSAGVAENPKTDPDAAFGTSGFASEQARLEAARRSNEQQRIERSQTRLDERISGRLQTAPQVRTEEVREDVRVQLDELAKERKRQRQVLTEVYNRMSVDGVAAVVDDLVESGRIDSATTVLSVLEDRSAARVLAIVAGPRPDAAAMITARLQDSSPR